MEPERTTDEMQTTPDTTAHTDNDAAGTIAEYRMRHERTPSVTLKLLSNRLSNRLHHA